MEQYNQPSRTDYYIAQLTSIVQNSLIAWAGGKEYPEFEEYLMKFGSSAKEEGGDSGEIDTPEQLAMGMATWMARVGMDPQVIKKEIKAVLTVPDEIKLQEP